MNNEKLRELLARGKKKGKLDSADLMDAVDDLNLRAIRWISSTTPWRR